MSFFVSYFGSMNLLTYNPYKKYNQCGYSFTKIEVRLLKSLFKRLSNKPNITIEFCVNNLDQYISNEDEQTFQVIVEHPRIQIKEFECLSQCELCAKKLYAKVNSEIITADSVEKLIQSIKEKLD